MKKILYIKQTDLKDCGVACLIAITNYYGGNVTREYLRELTKTTKDGVSLYSLLTGAEKLGFEARAVRSNVLKIKADLPVIAHILINKQIGHFVVITKVTDNSITVMDPELGFKTYGFNAWKEISTNVYLLLKPKTEILKQVKDKSFFKIIFPILKIYKSTFFILFFFSLIYTISSILLSYEFQFFLDALTLNNLKTLRYLFLFLLLVIIIKEMTNFFRDNLINYINHKLEGSLLNEVYNHVIKLPYLYFQNRTKGDIITRIKDVFIIKDVITKLLVTCLIDFTLIITILFFLFKINSKLAILTLIITFFYVLVIIIYNNFLTDKMNILKEKESVLNNYLIESLSSIDTIKGMQIEDVLSNKLSVKYKLYQDISFDLYHSYYQENFFKELIYGIGMLVIVYVSLKKVFNNIFVLSKLLVFNSLLVYYFTPIQNICNLQILFKEAKVSFTRIKELLNMQEENFLLDEKVINKHLKGNIKIKDLHYSYNGINEVLKCQDLEIRAGEHVLLYGLSGGGKSTLMKLITRYIEKYEGDIYLDDRKIYNYNLKELRKRITYLSQDEVLFTDTIYNNIVLNYQVSYEEYLKIIKICGVDKIIERSLLKDNMLIENNASNLSGGERQRILLARSLVKDSDIYIFDESFNAIDTKNERIILENIFLYLKNKTVIVISHRFNNQDLYQRIILVQGGIIYEY